MSNIQPILDRVLAGERMSTDECTRLLESHDIARMGAAADEIRARRHPNNIVTYIIDRNINYTNVCNVVCTFCAFYRRPGAPDTYVRTFDEICQKIDETIALGGTGVLMQGGHHPDLGIDYYEDLFRSIKARYRIHLHALSPSEVQHISRRSKLTIPETLTRLRDAGLDSIPGGGAEILVDRVRDAIAPKKTTSSEWLNVMRHAHRLGHKVPRDAMPTSFDYLLTQAISRIYLDNVDHIQSSWVTQGMKIGQVALEFGADDLGSIMIEEIVVSAAGTTYRATTDEFVRTIRALGKTPVQRDTLYREVRVYN